jgi:predicted RNA-binding Zn-ribbon protein involved in translation (DUF1610 family)
MFMATENVKVLIGTKIEAAEAKKLDPAKMGISMAAAPAASEVEGQAIVLAYTRCPWCGHVGRSVVSTNTYNWYRCGGCGGAFRA